MGGEGEEGGSLLYVAGGGGSLWVNEGLVDIVREERGLGSSEGVITDVDSGKIRGELGKVGVDLKSCSHCFSERCHVGPTTATG